VVIPLQKEEVRQKVQTLVDKGARGFVVSLLWSFVNPAHEQLVRAVIQEEYPDPYLGNMPILLSSEVQPKWHEYPRTNVVILSAYLHTEMTEQLSALGEELRDYGYKKPLSIINNSAYLLREEIIGKTEEVENLLRQIEGGIKRTQTIINNLLDFSRPTVHELELVDLKNLMEQILSLEGRALSTNNIKLRSELKAVPRMMANLDSLKHVFLNLLINAVQSMSQGGTLGIKINQEDNSVTVEISDTGIGIAEKDLPKIFDPFFSTKEPGEGTGLGLAFVHSEIERMGATIRVESKLNVGSTFIVEFPLREHENAG
jgi:signal transduction histidine kinase